MKRSLGDGALINNDDLKQGEQQQGGMGPGQGK